jgi:hypothetical protein
MATNVTELLESQNWDTPFQPYVEMSLEADALTFYFKPNADYSQRLTDHVTLYRSLESNELVGCRIKGIRAGRLREFRQCATIRRLRFCHLRRNSKG